MVEKTKTKDLPRFDVAAAINRREPVTPPDAPSPTVPADPHDAPVTPPQATGPTPEQLKAQREQWTKDAEAARKKNASDLKAAHAKTAKANGNMAADAQGLRIEPEIREGETRYWLVQTVPVRLLTDEEVKALESMSTAA